MKRARIFCLSFVICLAASAIAQSKSAAPAASPAVSPAPQVQQTPQAPPSVASVVDREVSTAENEFVGAAEAMPEGKYNFAPTGLNIPGSEFKGVRTFAEQVKHVALTNYQLWGPITGDKSPMESKTENGPDSLKTKAEIIKYLKDSFALGHKAAQSVTPENMMTTCPNPFEGRNPH